ncbi:unnamed protein product [Phyllotreta striolata]|uniref:polo kinase n=1 Tax=Phyllotreta striolata TaxID=444603 RepID=A0A9N9TM53_PHYSR|nr:unnamed protein product [Phyllotreta striolata]
MAKKLAVFDFDHTIIHDNSDVVVMNMLDQKKIPPEVKQLHKSDGWTMFMQGIFDLLHKECIMESAIRSVLVSLPEVPGMINLIRELHEEHNYDVIIISDSNSFFINSWLEDKGLKEHVLKVFTNPAQFDETGLLNIKMYHLQDTLTNNRSEAAMSKENKEQQVIPDDIFDSHTQTYYKKKSFYGKSMMELQKRRKFLTEPETRCYMRQILSGVNYLHQNRIIHRDLKLGNLFLNDELVVKIGDFGLAAKIEYEGERKKTLCGTPNYIAPEILNKLGHSFEVDIWSIGCIMYTLLIGRPPFETNSLKETYSRIRKCQYRINVNISSPSKHMIMLMLQSQPESRPKVSDLLKHEFIVTGYCPSKLPASTLYMAPRFETNENTRKPLIELNNGDPILITDSPQKRNNSIAAGIVSAAQQNGKGYVVFDAKENFATLKEQLLQAIKAKPARQYNFSDEMTDPSAQPMIWVSKWVDYSDKYGFGYQLSDEGVGVMFNDTTKLILLPNGINVHYIDKNGEESYMTIDNYPSSLEKKIKLLSYFSRYMKEHLLKTGASAVKEIDSISRIPHLHQWCRSTSGVLMQLNNGTVQINFGDHTKIIMCPLMAAVTFIDEDRSFRTFRFETIKKHGCPSKLYEKMRYAHEKLNVLLSS